ncbi:hypothetical protein GH733_007827 [Mirounga leonina]|nr:hypothetical protein GH733_007827 [Mirounga leonina]
MLNRTALARVPEPAKSGTNGYLSMPVEASVGGRDDGFQEAKYVTISSVLDQINCSLNHLEEKNDHFHARLQELLESNRQTRLEFSSSSGRSLAISVRGATFSQLFRPWSPFPSSIC